MWDPAAGGGNGDYVNLNCAAVDVHIAPFQAFWVRTTDNNPVLEIPEAAYLESADEGYFKELHYERSAMSPKDIADLGQAPGGFIFSLDLQGNDGLFTNNVHILFSEQGTEGMDRFDAPKLSPAGLAGTSLSMRWMRIKKRTLSEACRSTWPSRSPSRWASKPPSPAAIR